MDGKIFHFFVCVTFLCITFQCVKIFIEATVAAIKIQKWNRFFWHYSSCYYNVCFITVSVENSRYMYCNYTQSFKEIKSIYIKAYLNPNRCDVSKLSSTIRPKVFGNYIGCNNCLLIANCVRFVLLSKN